MDRPVASGMEGRKEKRDAICDSGIPDELEQRAINGEDLNLAYPRKRNK